LRRVPAPLVDEARRHELPLIALHREIPFVEVTETLHRHLVNAEVLAMERADELQRRFTDLVLDGAGVPGILEALARAIGNPVVLERDDGAAAFLAALDLPEPTVSAAAEAARRRFPDAPRRLVADVPAGRGLTWGTLTALALRGPLEPADEPALERAVGVIGLALASEHQERALAARRRGEFLAELASAASGGIDETEATARAAELGLSRRTALLLPVAAARRGSPTATDEAEWGLVWREVGAELTSRGIHALIGVRPVERDLVAVVALRNADDRGRVADQVAEVVRAAAIRGMDAEDIVVCVGSTAGSWRALSQELRDAVEATPAARHAPPRLWHDTTVPDLDRLFWGLRGQPALPGFLDRVLEPLEAHDRRHRSQFVATLDAYFAHRERRAETARALHLQRQSLYKRLARIEALLGGSLADPDLRLALHMALRARRALGDGRVNVPADDG
jgi:PucR family transcriptional regulator, purine catabolism regulatory protein